MKQNNNLNRFQQLLFHTFPPLMYLILFGLTKTETAKTAPRAKNWVLRLRATHFSAPARLGTFWIDSYAYYFLFGNMDLFPTFYLEIWPCSYLLFGYMALFITFYLDGWPCFLPFIWINGPVSYLLFG